VSRFSCRGRAVLTLMTLLAGCSPLALAPISGSPSEANRVSAQAARVSIIYSLQGTPMSSVPEAGLIVDARGNLYGTAAYGGAVSSGCSIGCGTAFELSSEKGKWNESVLNSFNNSETGLYPSNPLIFDATGNLYGTTQVGGDQGVAFELLHEADGWKYKVLHIFMGCRDGQQPRSGLTELDGNFYGTTVAGGNNCSGGNGTVFELSRSGRHWKERIVHRFRSYRDGASPQAGLTFDSSGNLYGTTSNGGNNSCASGCGTIFELSPSQGGGWSERVLHRFNGSDGFMPLANLVWDAYGNLYGSAEFGGDNSCAGGGCGTIFKLSRGTGTRWRFSVVYEFPIQSAGSDPAGNMVFDGSGNLYGTTVAGGNVKACPQPGGCGVVFKLSPTDGKWKYSVLHIFNNAPDGALPNGLVTGAHGRFFGTTIGGGVYSMGTAFEVVQ
jgi:uncharacterized repeat protein (TIGR03803 family)